MKNTAETNQTLNAASRGALIGILVYLFLASLKLSLGYLFKAYSVQADGLNNLSDIFASTAVFIGIHIAKKPADNNHPFGHEKFESISSFIVSLLMISIGLQVIRSSIHRFFTQDYSQASIQVIIATLLSSLILFNCQIYLKRLADQSQSIGLAATAKDMQSDLMISLSTLIGSFAVELGWPILDNVLSFVVGVIILYSAYEIFKESTFTLSDGFDQEYLETYQTCILSHPQVKRVSAIRARMSSQRVYLDATIELDPTMTVLDSHRVTEEIEAQLLQDHQVQDADIHVEPFT